MTESDLNRNFTIVSLRKGAGLVRYNLSLGPWSSGLKSMGMEIEILFGILAFGNDFKTIVNDFTWKILNSRVQTLRILPLTHNQNTFDRKKRFWTSISWSEDNSNLNTMVKRTFWTLVVDKNEMNLENQSVQSGMYQFLAKKETAQQEKGDKKRFWVIWFVSEDALPLGKYCFDSFTNLFTDIASNSIITGTIRNRL